MNRLAATLAQVRSDLDELAVSWAVVGGLAVSCGASRDSLAISMWQSSSTVTVMPSQLFVRCAIAAIARSSLSSTRPATTESVRRISMIFVRSLLQATEEETSEVRRLLTLIAERGFARRRDLGSALDAVVRELRR